MAPYATLELVEIGYTMRDIRQDLQDRLDATTREQEQLQKQMDDLEAKRRMLAALLQEESRRWSGIAPPVPTSTTTQNLADIILDIISDGDVWQGGRIADLALRRGFQFGQSKPRRVVHSTLIGLKNNIGTVDSLGNGKWQLHKDSPIKDRTEERQSQ